jgi:hypothetical protein
MIFFLSHRGRGKAQLANPNSITPVLGLDQRVSVKPLPLSPVSGTSSKLPQKGTSAMQ